MSWLRLPPCPPMPKGALPPALRAALGKSGGLRLWQDLYDRAIHAGQDIGRAEGAVGASLGWIALILLVLALAIILRKSR